MRKNRIVIVKYLSTIFSLILCAFLLAYGSSAHGSTDAERKPIVREFTLNVETLKIFPVLEDKIENEKFLKRSKEKVYSMNSRDLRLMAALCEKISEEKQTVSSDIAFLLVTALIVLS